MWERIAAFLDTSSSVPTPISDESHIAVGPPPAVRCGMTTPDLREGAVSPGPITTVERALQVFNRRQRGGRHWFDRGWNWRGLAA